MLFIFSPEIGRASGDIEFGYIALVEPLEIERLGLSNPAGLTANALGGPLFLLEKKSGNFQTLSVNGHLLDTDVLLQNAQHIEYDKGNGRLLFFDPDRQQLMSLPMTSTASGTTLNSRSSFVLPINAVSGIAVEPESGDIFVIIGSSGRLMRFRPGSSGQVQPLSAAEVDLAGNPAKLQGLAFDPASGHFFTLNPQDAQLVEMTSDGSVVKLYDLSPFNLGDPVALTFAPSNDLTDEETATSVYIATGGTNGDIYEFTLTPPPPPAMAADTPTLVQSIATWQFDPASPDASGATYLPHSNRILETDSEVNEKPVYEDFNQFEMDLFGNVVANYDTECMVVGCDKADKDIDKGSFEPTGIAFDSGRDHLFISDDDADRIYEVSLSYELIRFFDAPNVGGLADAEGAAFDSTNDRLYIAGGTTNKIYWIDPGPDHVFGNTDDIEGAFSATGLSDPEGIAFNHFTGTVYGVAGDEVVEYTPTGSQVRIFDISAANPRKAAGLAYAPSSTGSGWSLYVTARGYDDDEAINGGNGDGMIYEFTHELLNPPNADPNVPGSPTPGDATTGNSTTTDLSWTGGDPDGDPVTYDLYLGTTNPPSLLYSGLTDTSFDPGTLTAEEDYYWQIVAHDDKGGSTDGPIWHFSTHIPPGSVMTQTIPMGPGWKMFSSIVLPENLDFSIIFTEVVSDVVIVKDVAGDVYWPDMGINNIVWDTCHGYQVKLSSAISLEITGGQIAPEQTACLLDGGWNLIAYLRDSSMAVATAVATCSSETVMIKDGLGQIYWPAYGVDQIGTMNSGEGYEIFLSAPCTLVYPANAP